MKKKIIAISVLAAMVLTLSACGSSDSTDTETTTAAETAAEVTESEGAAEETTEAATEAETEDATAADANIKIVSHKMSTDYEGKDVLVIEYEWTNTSDENASFMWSFTDKVFQNGIECDSGVIGCDDVDSDTQMNEIQPGTTYNVTVGYLLQDNTNVTVTVSEIFGDELLNETIELGGGEGAAAPSAEGVETSVKIVGHTLSTDYNGDNVLVVSYEFCNGEDSAEAFTFLFTDKAFQNGVQCDSSVIGCDDIDSQTQLTEIQPGATYTVTVGYHISDTSDVTVEVTELFGSTEYLSETISLS